jgi:hypothetical protein
VPFCLTLPPPPPPPPLVKVSHHHLTPICDVYEVLRCLEHEKSFKTVIYENCSGVGLKVLRIVYLLVIVSVLTVFDLVLRLFRLIFLYILFRALLYCITLLL